MGNNNESKPWYLSLTILAALATVAQGTIYEMTQVLDPYLPPWLKAVLMAITTGLAVFGRVRATMGIGSPKPPVVGMLLVLAVAGAGCGGFPGVLDKAHKSVAAAGRTVIEPPLAAACLARAKKCKADGVSDPLKCAELVKCRAIKTAYSQAKAGMDIGLAAMNRVYFDCVSAGIIVED